MLKDKFIQMVDIDGKPVSGFIGTKVGSADSGGQDAGGDPSAAEPTETIPSAAEPTETIPSAAEPTETIPSETKPTETPQAPTYGQSLDLSVHRYDPAADAAYQQAMAALQQATGTKPTYAATYDQQLSDLYDKIVNREQFSYDLNGDALYQQMAQQYAQMGHMAMMDTMGQAAAMTGGYGSSYGQAVGQQAYQGYMRQLNDKVPELYDRALAQYNQEGQNLMNQYGMLGDMRDTEYGRYLDSLNQYWQNVGFQKELADDAYTRGYTASRDAASDAAAEYDAGYRQWLDSWNMQNTLDQQDQAQANWQASFDHGVAMDAQEQANWQASFDHGVAMDTQAQANLDRNYLVNLITTTGYEPTAEELAAAGMSEKQVKSYQGYYNASNIVQEAQAAGATFGEFTAEKFFDSMVEAASLGDKNMAKALVVAAGASDTAYAVYYELFGEEDEADGTPQKWQLGYNLSVGKLH